MGKFPVGLVCGAISLILVLLGLHAVYNDPNLCSLSWRTAPPICVELDFNTPQTSASSNYKLYLFREDDTVPQFEVPKRDYVNLGGTPVLFVPGNLGSYWQGRAMASLAAQWPEFDWFLADLNEDMSALHGLLLMNEAVFVNEAIAYILNLYRQRENPPESVLIVAHSMGGIVARTIVTLDNYIKNSVNTIITFSTPHAHPLLTFDRDVTQLYDVVGQWWRNNEEDISLISLAGGHMDLLVPPAMTMADSFGGFSAFSYGVPEVGLGIDHLAIVWCVELRQVVLETIGEIANYTSPGRMLPNREKMSIVQRRFRQTPRRVQKKPIMVPESVMYGKTAKVTVMEDTEFVLPSLSSLISYEIQASNPVTVAQHTAEELRVYGTTEKTTLMWYSAMPFVPFYQKTQLVLQVLDVTTTPTTVSISVNWRATFANIFQHYRTLAACWPYALVLVAVIIARTRSGTTTSTMISAMWAITSGPVLYIITGVLILAYIALCSPEVRSLVRAIQFPSEAATVAALQHRRYDANDLLLGNIEPRMWWSVIALIGLASSAVLLVAAASVFIISIRTFVVNKAVGKRAPVIKRSSPNRAKLAVQIAVMCIVFYVVPYQVSTVVLAVVQLLRTRDTREFRFAVSQILLWTAVVDVPFLVVWLRNLQVDWLVQFASLRNVTSVLPIALYVISVPNQVFHAKHPLVRVLTLGVVVYSIGYAFMYGALHGFMIHHLTNYLALWCLVLNFA